MIRYIKKIILIQNGNQEELQEATHQSDIRG